MPMANSNAGGIPVATEQEILTKPEMGTRETIHWGRIAKLPVVLLSVMTILGLLIASHTQYTEMESDRLIAETDRLVADAIAEDSTADAMGSHR